MRRAVVCAAACVLTVVVGIADQQPQTPADPIKAASEELGAAGLKTLRYSAFGANFTVGQSPSATEPWPRVSVRSYEATINYDTSAMRVDMTREQRGVPPRGGGLPFVGEQRQIQVVRGATAWNEQPPAPGGRDGARRGGGPESAADAARMTLDEAGLLVGIGRLGATPPTPQPNAVMDRRLQIFLTPHGFLKGAAANNATIREVVDGTEVAYTFNGRYRLIGLINSSSEIAKITTWIDNPVLGDMPIEATFSNYQKFENGVSFPLRIVQTTGGHPSLDLWVSSVSSGVMAEIDVPADLPPPPSATVTVTNEQIAPGVQYLRGGTHHSVAIEMRDHVVLVEAPLSEERASALVAKVKELFPNKPIRYVVNTHHHFDHSGGLRTVVAEGATVITHRRNQAFYRRAWSAPRTLVPDRLSQVARTPTFVPVAERHILTDGARSIQIHRIADSPHHDGFLMVYLPAEKILIEADAYTPAAPATPGVGGQGRQSGAAAVSAALPPANPTTKNLYDNIQRLRLDVASIAALHGSRLATLDDLRTAITPTPVPATAAARLVSREQGGEGLNASRRQTAASRQAWWGRLARPGPWRITATRSMVARRPAAIPTKLNANSLHQTTSYYESVRLWPCRGAQLICHTTWPARGQTFLSML